MTIRSMTGTPEENLGATTREGKNQSAQGSKKPTKFDLRITFACNDPVNNPLLKPHDEDGDRWISLSLFLSP
jgi:hypothetical protein